MKHEASFRFALAIAGILLLAVNAAADTFTVDNTGDEPGDCAVPGQCTLRAAFEAAAANGVDDLIELSKGETYTLSNGSSPGLDATDDVIEIAVFDQLAAEVASPFDTAIDAAGLARHFIVRSGATLDVRGVTLRGGVQSAGNLGGSIAVNDGGTLLLTDVVVAGNIAGSGGGIFAAANSTATLTRTVVSGNQVVDATARGGGIHNAGALTLTDTTVAGNAGTATSPTNLVEGGGIYNTNLGSIVMTRGGVVQHEVASLGGGIYTEGAGPGGNQLTLTDVALHVNRSGNAGAGLYSESGAGPAVLDGVSIISNTAVGDGGGIRNESSDMDVLNALIQGNTSTGLRGGGIAHSDGILNIDSSDFLDNTAPDTATDGTPGQGGGLRVLSGSPVVTITNSFFDNNSSRRDGGAISAAAGTLSIDSSTFTNNQVTDQGANDGNGGAIWTSGATLVVERSDIQNNNAPTRGAGVFVAASPGAVRIVDTNISNNDVGALPGDMANGDGGGLYIAGGNLSVAIVRSTLANNSTRDEGGAMATNGTVTILNSTISGNSAGDRGGAIVEQSGTVVATNVTFTLNSAVVDGEVFLGNGISLFNSILEHDTTDGVDVCADVLNPASDFNVIESGTGENCDAMGADNLTIPESLIDLDPTLQYNGGPFGLETHAVADTSLAVDAGDPSLCDTGADTDLDNRSATRSEGLGCDAGAFEVGALPVAGVVTISGTASGASPGITVTIDGVEIGVDTSNGESASTVASNLADEINATSSILGLGVQAVAIGDSVSIDDLFEAGTAPDPGLSLTSTDFETMAVPGLGTLGIVALGATLPLLGFRELKASGRTQQRA